MKREAPHYTAARIQRTIAEDDRIAELGIHVDVRGDQVFLHGHVGTEERRRLIGVVASEVEPGLHFHNEINVVEVRDPTGKEQLA